eukprot:952081-Prymnesium_polylepis.1
MTNRDCGARGGSARLWATRARGSLPACSAHRERTGGYPSYPQSGGKRQVDGGSVFCRGVVPRLQRGT